MNMKKKLGWLAVAAGLCMANTAFAQLVVIVHRSSSVNTMTAQQVSQIFLGSSNTFPDGSTATPVDTQDASLREAFMAKVLDKSPGQVRATWSRIVFSGKGQPPRELAAAAVKAFVAANPGAIGYIEKSSADATVKIVFTAP